MNARSQVGSLRNVLRLDGASPFDAGDSEGGFFAGEMLGVLPVTLNATGTGSAIYHSQPFSYPPGAAFAMCVLFGFSVEYTNDDHHVRILEVGIGFSNASTVTCVMQLADNSGTAPV